MVQEAWSLRSGYQHDWVLVKVLFWVADCQLLFVDFPGDSDGKKSTCNARDLVWSLGWEDPRTSLCILTWPERVKELSRISFVRALIPFMGLPRCYSGKESSWQCRRCRGHGFDPWVRKIPWRREWQPTPVFSPGKFHGKILSIRYS